MTKEFVFSTKRNNQIRATAYGFEHIESAPCIILVHGFKGFKDWGFWPETGKSLAQNGFFVLSFNFSHNGIGENLLEFTELDKFAENTFSLEISELNEIITAYKNNFFGDTQNDKIGLLGHSRGGAVAILTASERPDITAIAVWAPVAVIDRYSERQKNKWKKEGVFEVTNSRTGQVMKLKLSLLEDIETNSAVSLNIRKAAENLHRPLLISHGEQDLTVPINEGELLYEWSDKSYTEFFGIKSAGHTFGIVHPFEGTNKNFDALINKTINFFKSYLMKETYAGY